VWPGAGGQWWDDWMSGLPGGGVTFLFTDIEGSTRLVKALRERYARVLAEHRGLVRAAIAANGGHEVDTQGDAFFVAFGGAAAELCAVLLSAADDVRVLATSREPLRVPGEARYRLAPLGPARPG